MGRPDYRAVRGAPPVRRSAGADRDARAGSSPHEIACSEICRCATRPRVAGTWPGARSGSRASARPRGRDRGRPRDDPGLARRPDRAAARGHEGGAGLRAHRHRQRTAAPGRRRPGARPRGRGHGPRAPAPLHRPPGVVRGVPRPHRPPAVEGAALRPPSVRGGAGPAWSTTGGRPWSRPSSRGPQPRAVANVRIFWERAPGKPDEYSYDDTLSSPNLRVTQKRLITYRLVDYEDRLWYAEVAGLHGRPDERRPRRPLRPHRRGARAGEPERLSPRRRAGGARAGEQVGHSTGPRR